MHEAYFQKNLIGRQVQCTLCPHSCNLMPGQQGICGTRVNRGGKLYALNYGILSAISTDPIEKKPLYHFYPGRSILSIGSLGCNLKCDFCQNHHISQPEEGPWAQYPERQARDIVEKASMYRNNLGLAYTYNEPTVSYEFVMDCARGIREAGMHNVMVSNGYIQPEALDELLPWIDAFNIDLKSFRDDFYLERTGARLGPVLQSIERIARSDAHLELTFLIIPGQNDQEEEWQEMIDWIVEHCGPETVVHVSRYFPRFKMDVPPTSIERIQAFLALARGRLDYVYPGNLPGLDENTLCPSCGSILVEREGYSSRIRALDDDGKCSACARQIRGRFKQH